MNNSLTGDVLVEVRKLVKHFPVAGGLFSRTVDYLKAVDEVSFNIKKGETLGIVGESGCGKSTLGRVIIRLLEPTSGEVLFRGQKIFGIPRKEFQKLRRDMQIMFQDPYGSLNPRMSVEKIIGEPLEIHGIAKGSQRIERVKELLEVVGLSPSHIHKYPHMFSGGQRQRIGVARTLALRPIFMILDEPVSSLDVSTQSQIINLFEDLQEKFALTYLFISHDLSVVKHISDRVGVMYLGQIVEMAPVSKIFSHPSHPYTKALLSAIPKLKPDGSRKRILLTGDLPSPIHVPKGCRFHTRCYMKMDICVSHEPTLMPVDGDKEHLVACNLKTS